MKILDVIYAKADLEQVAYNATHINAEDIAQLLRILRDFGDLFDGTLGDWDTETVDLNLKTNYKPFNFKYYLVPMTNKENFHNELEHLVNIVVLTLVQHSQ